MHASIVNNFHTRYYNYRLHVSQGLALYQNLIYSPFTYYTLITSNKKYFLKIATIVTITSKTRMHLSWYLKKPSKVSLLIKHLTNNKTWYNQNSPHRLQTRLNRHFRPRTDKKKLKKLSTFIYDEEKALEVIPDFEEAVALFVYAAVIGGISVSYSGETVKFGHTTFFWNENRSGYFNSELEEYADIPSDGCIITFNVQPKMKALEIGEKARDAIRSGKFDQVKHYIVVDIVTTIGLPIKHIEKKKRDYGEAIRVFKLISDAMNNKGNSCGPHVNIDGEVIGVNTSWNVGS
ncbi:phosphoglycerate mutase, 2,3-bisphosphoglycerate-independent [Artemisia annua]|uniref:Phosphoglycerate mutase, 2,3-bisphosphoglycerate-independent n=1 Tax=Artemisia annua TaxID=35608 RepID=A0A2U1Q448_ARTAN|nr:phosphoglycerate mutase, 2,3-bisphosphoglycerate-independent [Artemisia annua]